MSHRIDNFLEEHENAMVSIKARLRETQELLGRILQEDGDVSTVSDEDTETSMASDASSI
jgi:hypothetical protein